MPHVEVIEPHASGALSQAAAERKRIERERLTKAKEAVLRILKRSAPQGGKIDLRDLMFTEYGIQPRYTLAALRELTHQGIVELGGDYQYHLTPGQR